MLKCQHCNKEFQTNRSLAGHLRMHSPKNAAGDKKRGENQRKAAMEKYYTNPRKCQRCDAEISYETYQSNRYVKFCGSSCAASTTNANRKPRSEESRKKTADALRAYHGTNKKLPKNDNKVMPRKILTMPLSIHAFRRRIAGEYSRLYLCSCAHCGVEFCNRSSVKYCIEHKNLYKRNNRNRYAFTFSISKYPDLFGNHSQLLSEFGMWTPKNPNGVTRDHKISVNEAILNDYDPYYIRHPLNCELMSHNENNKKNINSSMVYEDLVSMVDEYESRTL